MLVSKCPLIIMLVILQSYCKMSKKTNGCKTMLPDALAPRCRTLHGAMDPQKNIPTDGVLGNRWVI